MNILIDQIKSYRLLLLLILISVFARFPFISRVPNSASPEEIQLFERLHIYFPLNSPFSVLFQTVIAMSTLISIFLLVRRVTKNDRTAFWCGLSVSLAPWFFILSIHFNIYLFLLLLFSVICLLPLRGKTKIMLATAAVLLIPLLLGRTPFIHTFLTRDSITDLMKITDIRTVFFTGDWASTFIRIPKTGYLMYSDILFLLIGIYTAQTLSKKKIIPFLALLFIGIIFFLAHIYNFLPSYRALFILLVYSTLVGLGYERIFSGKNASMRILFAVVLTVNVLFYGELLFFHFDRQNSSDWTYAQTQIVNYATSNKITRIYLTNNSNDLSHFLNYYLGRGTNIALRPLETLKGACIEKQTLCIFTEEDMRLIAMPKEQALQQFTVYSGLPIYFATRY